MKQINTYINEKLHLTSKYSCQPKDYYELRAIIFDRIKNEGPDCDLNDIDVSKVTYMPRMFDATYKSHTLDAATNDMLKDFNGDISMWDVSNVTDMRSMFDGCEKFNCDISMWDVSNVKNMPYIFYGCKKFKQDLNSWDVSNVEDMCFAFTDCPTTPTWYDRKQCE